jgi:hypothetical protein
MEATTETRLRGLESRMRDVEAKLAKKGRQVGAADTVALPEPTTPPAGEHVFAFDIDSFTDAHRLSRSMLYKLWREGSGPDYITVGHKRIISYEAATRWRKKLEQTARAVAEDADDAAP